MRRVGLVSSAVGGGVLLVGLAVALLPGGAVPGAGDRWGAPTVPDQLAGYSHLTADVSASPPGRGLALFQFGFGVEFLDFPQAVVVGADGDVQRRVDLAEDASWPQTQGDPAPMLLSPDGTRVAVGDHRADRPEIAVVDLATGAVARHPVPVRRVLPVAWSPDGARLAYLDTASDETPIWGAPVAGDVGLLDLVSGQAAAVPGATGVQAAAFAPDGTELAVQHGDAAGGGLDVVPLDGGTGRTLTLPAGHRLESSAAWSPDGALLAISAVDDIAFLDATGQGRTTPAPIGRAVAGRGPVLGWTAPDRVVTLAADPSPATDVDPDRYLLVDIPFDGSAPRPLTEVPTSDGNYGVARFQLATGLLPDLGVREAGDVDRGRWPLPLRLGTALVLTLLAAGATRLIGSRLR